MINTKKSKSHYEVIVGNIGTVYSGPLFQQALEDYGEYKRQSIDNYGRAAGEPVTLLQDGEPIMEVTYPEQRETKVHERRLGEIPAEYPGKGCGIWSGRDCSVFRNCLGGLTYRYRATHTSCKPWCEFTLFCEVGAPYQPLFSEFFEKFTVDGTVDYDGRPYLADHCK